MSLCQASNQTKAKLYLIQFNAVWRETCNYVMYCELGLRLHVAFEIKSPIVKKFSGDGLFELRFCNLSPVLSTGKTN